MRISGEVVIDRPVDVVFDFVADATNEPHYNPGARRSEKLSEGPVGLGTRFRSVIVSMGRSSEWLTEITGFDRPRHLDTSVRSAAMHIVGSQDFEPVGRATRMHWSWQMTARGVYRLLTPLVRLFGRRMEERNWLALKRYLESQPAIRE